MDSLPPRNSSLVLGFEVLRGSRDRREKDSIRVEGKKRDALRARFFYTPLFEMRAEEIYFEQE